jgi:hypothetical protein
MSQRPPFGSRRRALKCMAFGGAAGLGKPLFVQISDTHIGFNKDANPM